MARTSETVSTRRRARRVPSGDVKSHCWSPLSEDVDEKQGRSRKDRSEG